MKSTKLLDSKKVTLRFLFESVSLRQLSALASCAVGLLVCGVYLGEAPIVRQYLKLPAISRENELLVRPAEVSFLPGDFVIDINDPYDRSNVTDVTVRVASTAGQATLERRADLLKTMVKDRYFTGQIGKLELVGVTPKTANVSPVETTSEILLEFDSSSLIPLADVVTGAKAGDKLQCGHVLVRLYYAEHGHVRSADVDIPMYLVKVRRSGSGG